MDGILRSLSELSTFGYERSIFNFYVRNEKVNGLSSLMESLKNKVEHKNRWDDIWEGSKGSPMLLQKFKSKIQSISLCLSDRTFIFRNPDYVDNTKVTIVSKTSDQKIEYELSEKTNMKELIDIYEIKESPNLPGLIHWILCEKNPIISYIKTINKKRRTKFMELYKAVLNKPHQKHFAGELSNELKSDTIKLASSKTPWIKEYETKLKVQILNDKIVSGGRTGLSQSIDITLANKTCLILFKNGTFHVLLSKQDNEQLLDFLKLILDVLEFICLFQLLFVTTVDRNIFKYGEVLSSVDRTNVNEMIAVLSPKTHPFYPIKNISLGILNLTNTKLKISPVMFSILKEMNINKQIKLYTPNYINFVVIKSEEELITLINNFHTLLQKVKKLSKQKRTSPFFGTVPNID